MNAVDQEKLSADFAAAMMKHMTKPVTIELPVGTLFILASSVQTVLRRPDFPAASREELEGFISGVEQTMTSLDPVFGRIIALGRDPGCDVPSDEPKVREQAMLPHRMERMLAYVAQAEDGREGILTLRMPDGVIWPMIGSDDARMESLRPNAEEASEHTLHKVLLVEFSTRRELEEIG